MPARNYRRLESSNTFLLESLFKQIKLYGIDNEKVTTVTSARYDSYSPAWSPDGQWLYLLSDRNLKTVVEDPWGSYQPEPFLDKKTKIYHLALTEAPKPRPRSRAAAPK